MPVNVATPFMLQARPMGAWSPPPPAKKGAQPKEQPPPGGRGRVRRNSCTADLSGPAGVGVGVCM